MVITGIADGQPTAALGLTLPPRIGTRKEVTPATDRHPTQAVLNWQIVDFESPVIAIAR